MTDRITEVATFIRRHPRADRGALLRAILDQWPDLSGDELQRAIDLRHGGRPVLVLPQQPTPNDQGGAIWQ
jgi:hypothetical protein